MVEELKKLITVNTFKGSDKFYFSNPPLVGTVNGYPAYCTFYYSHYNQYMVYFIVWKGNDGLYDFHYLSENDMIPVHEFYCRTLDTGGQFVPVTHIIDIDPHYIQTVYNATQEVQNIEHNKMYGTAYDRQREIHYLLRDVKTNNKRSYMKTWSMRQELAEYDVLHSRYVNLKPDIEAETKLIEQSTWGTKEIAEQYTSDKKMYNMVKKLMAKKY